MDNKRLFLQLLKWFILLTPLLYGMMGRLISPVIFLVMAVLIRLGLSQSLLRPAIPFEKIIRFVFYALLVFLLVQLVPLPMFLLKYISPATVRILGQMSQQLPDFHPISLIPFDTLVYACQLVAAALFYRVVLSVPLKKKELISLAYSVIFSAALLMAVGLLGVLFSFPLAGEGDMRYFSFYLTMVFPLVPALLLMELRYLESNRPLLKKILSTLAGQKKIIVLVILAVIFPVGIFVIGPRTAISTFLLSAAIISMCVYYFRRSRQVRRRLRVTFAAAALLVIFMGLQSTAKHLMQSRGGKPGESLRWHQTLSMTKAFPLAGAGFGTWQWVNPIYDRQYQVKWPPYANNGGLVILAEGGLIGALLVFALIALPIASITRLWWQRKHPQVRILVVGMLVCFLAAGLHSLFNAALFNPANIMALALLLGLGTKIANYKRGVATAFSTYYGSRIKIIAIVLIVFFGLQLISRGFAAAGNPGFSLESGGHNPFDYQYHLSLGSTYFSQQPLTEKAFKNGLASLKRSVRLQGGKNTGMTVRVLELILPFWQQLEKKDKKLFRKLMNQIIQRIDEKTCKALLAIWESHCREVNFFKGILENAPQYYNLAADALGRLQIDMKARQLFKLNHEIYTLNTMEKEYQKTTNQTPPLTAPDLLDRLNTLRRQLKESIPGYHEMIRGSKFRKQNYRELVQRLDLHILHLLFSLQEVEKASALIISYLEDNDFAGSDELEILYGFLEQRKFFAARGLKNTFIKGLIRFNTRDYTEVIKEIETIKSSSFSWVLENTGDYCRLLLLLSEAYIASRLLTRALPVLSEVGKVCTHAEHSMELYRQEMKIQYIIGSEEGKKQEIEAKTRANELIRRSRRIVIDELPVETIVYLVEGSDIEIHRGNAPFENRHLLQVFVDGCIRHEVYLNQWKPGEPVKIKILPFERFSKHRIKVTIK